MSPIYAINRLASINGYSCVTAMMKANKLKFASAQEDKLASYSTVLHRLTGKRIVWSNWKGFEADKSRYFKSLVAVTYRVCPLCLLEKSSLFEHRYVTTSHCIKHGCKLLDRCESCGIKHEYNKHTLNGQCSICSTKFRSTPTEIPEYQLHLNRINENARADFLFDICLAAGFILRPYDSIPTRVKLSFIDDFSSIFTSAYRLLVSVDFQQHWFQYAEEKRQSEFPFLGHSGTYAGRDHLNATCKLDWQHFSQSKSLFQVTENSPNAIKNEVKPSHFVTMKPLALRRYSNEEFNLYRRYGTTPSQLAQILGLPAAAIIKLMKRDILERSSKTNAYVYNQFDLRHIDGLLKAKALDTDGLTKIPLDNKTENVAKFLGLMRAEIDCLIELALSDSSLCIVSHKGEKLSSRIYCRKIGLIKHLAYRLKNDLNLKIIESEAKAIFGLSDIDIRGLKLNDVLHPQPYNHRHVFYKVSHLLNIDKQLFNLGRYCVLRSLNFKETAKKLFDAGINPIIGKSIFQCRYQVLSYLKYQELRDPICKFHKPVKFIPFTRKDPRKVHLLYN